MKRLAILVLLTLVVACGDDDDSPTSSPGDDLVGSWRGVTTTDTDSAGFDALVLEFVDDGSLTGTITVEGVGISIGGTWEIVGGKLVMVITAGGTSESLSGSYTIRDDRLTIAYDEDGVVETYDRS